MSGVGGLGVSRTKGGVLLLHGKGGNGRSFRDRVASDKTSLGRQLGLLDDGAGRHWDVFAPDGPVTLDTGGCAWWSFPEGVNRSYLADEWIGSQTALDLAQSKGQNCQLVLGFSQGAMLLAVLLSRGLLPECRAAVLVGAGWPKPYGKDVEDFKARGQQPIGGALVKPQILHVTSPSDTINPSEQALRVHACLGGDVLEHTEGHTVPLEGGPADALAQWINLKLAQLE